MNDLDPTRIVSREDLADFIESLREDFAMNSHEWENPSIDRYLDAMAAWVRAMDFYYKNRGEAVPSQPGWHTIGEILVAAKIYE